MTNIAIDCVFNYVDVIELRKLDSGKFAVVCTRKWTDGEEKILHIIKKVKNKKQGLQFILNNSIDGEFIGELE